MIKHVLNVTGHDSIQYVGLSMGTTGFMVAANEHPEFMERSVKMAHLTAPVAYVAHMRTPLVVLLPFSRLIEVGGIVSKQTGLQLTKVALFWLCKLRHCALPLLKSQSRAPLLGLMFIDMNQSVIIWTGFEVEKVHSDGIFDSQK